MNKATEQLEDGKRHSMQVQNKLKDRFLSKQESETRIIFNVTALILVLSVFQSLYWSLYFGLRAAATNNPFQDVPAGLVLSIISILAGLTTLIFLILEKRHTKDVFRLRFFLYKGMYNPKFKNHPKYDTEKIKRKLKKMRRRMLWLSRLIWLGVSAEIILFGSGMISLISSSF